MALALVVAASLLWLPACLAPLMRVSADGAVRQSFLTTGIAELWASGFPALAVVVSAFSMIVPWIYLLLITWVLAGVQLRSPRASRRRARISTLAIVYRVALALRPWAMIEVYLLGACVAYSRIEKLAHVELETAAWCLVAAAMLLFIADVYLDSDVIWRALPFVRRESPHAAERTRGSRLACTVCGLPAPNALAGDHCSRCGARLRLRKRASIGRTWALVLTGFLLYVPANLLPVLSIEQFGRSEPSTILGGVIELVHYGLWPLAAIVFTASIAIPLAKLCGLSWNLFLTQRGSQRLLVGRTRLHRVIEQIGRWSNIDVFMLSILVALVQFGELTRVRAENGMIAFAAVVILTMLASTCFDSRLMWDSSGESM